MQHNLPKIGYVLYLYIALNGRHMDAGAGSVIPTKVTNHQNGGQAVGQVKQPGQTRVD